MTRESWRSDWLTLVLLCLLGAGIGRWQSVARAEGRPDPISGVIQSVLVPITAGLRSGLDALGGYGGAIVGSGRLAAENRRLAAMEDAMRLYMQREREFYLQTDALRKAMGLPPIPGRTRIAADVIALFPHEQRITLGAGRRKGVVPGLAVVTGDGLLGIVQTVREETSQATLLGAQGMRVGASVRRDPPQAGILRGESSERLVLDFLESTVPLEVGDWVVTSGFSERVPGGIVIGRIVQIENMVDFGARRAYVFPSARLGQARQVFILR